MAAAAREPPTTASQEPKQPASMLPTATTRGRRPAARALLALLLCCAGRLAAADCDAVVEADLTGAAGFPTNADASSCAIAEAALSCTVTACASGYVLRNAGGTATVTCDSSTGSPVLTWADGSPALACVTEDEVCAEGTSGDATGLPANVDVSACSATSTTPCDLDSCETGFYELFEGTGQIACTTGGDPLAPILAYTAGSDALACVGAPQPPSLPAPGHACADGSALHRRSADTSAHGLSRRVLCRGHDGPDDRDCGVD